MTEYVTSDLHFGHEAIIESCNRPFKNVTVMDKELIRRWNSIVESPNDKVFVIGDFSLMTAHKRGTYTEILRRLRGRKILIAGNHDLDKLYFYAGDRGVGFEQVVYPYLEHEEFIMTHDPTLSIIAPDKPFLTGHVHQHWMASENSFGGVQMGNAYNVGVDVHQYRPISLDSIRTHFRLHTEIKVKGEGIPT